MFRLFVAIRPPLPIIAALRAIMHGVQGVRWEDASQLHVTLRFIGEVDRRQAEDVAGALERLCFAPFSVAVAGVSCFDRRGRATALWAGVTPHDRLELLHHKVDRLCVDAGLPADARAYLPHITLARPIRGAGPTDAFIARNTGFTTERFLVDQVMLFESILGREGATYHVVERYRANR